MSSITSLPRLDELRATFDAEVHRHTNWPGEFEVAMRDPIVGRLVRLLAIVRSRPRLIASRRAIPHVEARGGDRGNQHTGGKVQSCTLATSPAPRRCLDRKSLASGERDD